MNLVDLSLIVLIALTVFVGIKRGLLISLLSALRFIVSIPLSFFVGNNYNEIIYKNIGSKRVMNFIFTILYILYATPIILNAEPYKFFLG